MSCDSVIRHYGKCEGDQRIGYHEVAEKGNPGRHGGRLGEHSGNYGDVLRNDGEVCEKHVLPRQDWEYEAKDSPFTVKWRLVSSAAF